MLLFITLVALVVVGGLFSLFIASYIMHATNDPCTRANWLMFFVFTLTALNAFISSYYLFAFSLGAGYTYIGLVRLHYFLFKKVI